MNPAPPPLDIWLLRGTEEDGPHLPDEIAEMLATGDLAEECLACCEGMPEWRSVRETLVWSAGSRLSELRDPLEVQVEWILAGDSDRVTAQNELRKIAAAQGLVLREYEHEIVDTLLLANELMRWSAKAYGNRTASELESFPCWELSVVTQQMFPRDWIAAWQTARGRLSSGRMVARKDDLVWTRLSDFGFPFPPFTFDLGFNVTEVSREEGWALGLIDEQSVIQAHQLQVQPPLVGFRK